MDVTAVVFRSNDAACMFVTEEPRRATQWTGLGFVSGNEQTRNCCQILTLGVTDLCMFCVCVCCVALRNHRDVSACVVKQDVKVSHHRSNVATQVFFFFFCHHAFGMLTRLGIL